VCPESGGGLAGESPVSVVAKQRCSWWPAEGETRPSKRHDKVSFGGEQAAGPQHQANLAASLPPPAVQGKAGAEPVLLGRRPGTVRRSWMAAPRNPSAYGGWNGCIAHHRTGEIRLDTGVRAAGVPPRSAPVTAKPISGGPVKWWSVERKSEEDIVAVIGVDNRTRRSEGPLARCARPSEEGCGGTAFGYLPSPSLA
jgi:hypothetical protein